MPLAPVGVGGIAVSSNTNECGGSLLHAAPCPSRGTGYEECQQSVLRSFMIWIYNLGVVAIFSYATFIREFSMWTWVLALLLMASSDKELEK